MKPYSIVVATFDDHQDVDDAIHKLIDAGFNMMNFSVVGKGYQTGERSVGFHSIGDRIKIWGTFGAFWGGLSGLFFGSAFVSFPFVGPVVVLGYLAASVVTAVEGAIVAGGVSALGAALFTAAMHMDRIVDYESVINADGFLIIARGPPEEMMRAKRELTIAHAKTLDLHQCSGNHALVDSPTSIL
jgi:hypothetical protein